MKAAEVRRLVEQHGRKGFLDIVESLLVGRTLPNGLTLRRKPDEWSIRGLWEGLVGPVEETLPSYRKGNNFNFIHMEEAIDSTAFPTATGMLIAARVIEAYNAPGYIGDALVTNMPSRLKSETIVGFTASQGPKEVAEGDEYEDSSIGEKYVTTKTAKKGRIISITEETVFFDRTGQIMLRAQNIGEATRQEREKTILNGVQDTASNVYRPSGTAAALYSHANYTNNLTGGTALEDWSDIDAALTYHATNMKDDRQGETTEPVIWNPRQLLVPMALDAVARRIVNATEIRTATNSAAQTTLFGNPYAGRFTPLSSPYLDVVSANDWYLGDFPRQFIWHEVWPLQTFQQRADSELAFSRDIVARFKVRYYGGIAAIDTKYVVKVEGTA